MIGRALGLTILGGGLVVITACGGDEAPAAKYPTADSFCAAKAAEECKAVAAACVIAEARCKDVRAAACNSAAGVATSQGRTYRSESAESCIAKTTAVYTDRVIDGAKEAAFSEACARVFTGSKKKNEECSNEYDCEGTLACDLDKKLCSVKVEKKADEPCNNPGDICGKGLYCQPRGTVKFCTPKNKLGDSCRIPEAPCAEDLRCNGTSCVALQGPAQPCDTNDECTTRFCNTDRKCQARQYASETGTCKDFGGT
jgi:hypothetical protein